MTDPAPAEPPVRPHRPQSSARRFGLRSGVLTPTSSDVHWLLVDLDEPGGVGRAMVSRVGLVAVLAVGLGLYGGTTFESAILGASIVVGTVALAILINTIRVRRTGASRLLYGNSAIDDTGRAVVDTEHLRRQQWSTRFAIVIFVIYGLIGAFRIFAEPTGTPEVLDVGCAQTPDGAEIQIVVSNPGTDPVAVTLEIDVETDSGDRFFGTTSVRPEPEGEERFSVPIDASGVPLSCSARITTVIRFDTGPGVSLTGS